MDLTKEYLLFGCLGVCFVYAQYLIFDILINKKTLRDLKKVSFLMIIGIIVANVILLIHFLLSNSYKLSLFLSIFSTLNIIQFLLVSYLYHYKRKDIIKHSTSMYSSFSEDSHDFHKVEEDSVDSVNFQTVGDNGFDKTEIFKR